MELPVIRKDVRCYWQSKSLSSVQVKKVLIFLTWIEKEKKFVYNKKKRAQGGKLCEREKYSVY